MIPSVPGKTMQLHPRFGLPPKIRACTVLLLACFFVIVSSEFNNASVLMTSDLLTLGNCAPATNADIENVNKNTEKPESPKSVPFDVPANEKSHFDGFVPQPSSSRSGSGSTTYLDSAGSACASRLINLPCDLYRSSLNGDLFVFIPSAIQDRIFHPPRL